jgi:hypothetical protein
VVRWGAGPRAGQSLVLAAKARALLHGRLAATREDVRALAAPVLRHRLLLSFAAEAEQRQRTTWSPRCVPYRADHAELARGLPPRCPLPRWAACAAARGFAPTLRCSPAARAGRLRFARSSPQWAHHSGSSRLALAAKSRAIIRAPS